MQNMSSVHSNINYSFKHESSDDGDDQSEQDHEPIEKSPDEESKSLAEKIVVKGKISNDCIREEQKDAIAALMQKSAAIDQRPPQEEEKDFKSNFSQKSFESVKDGQSPQNC